MKPRPAPNTRHTLLGNSAYIFLIRFFPAVASLLVLILFSRQLPTALYGKYQNFWTQWAVLNAVACLGLPAFLLTYSASHIRQFLSSFGRRDVLLFAGWLLVPAGAFSALQWNSGLSPSWLPFVFLIVQAIATIGESLLLLGKRFRQVVFINLLYAVFFACIHWMVLKKELSFSNLFTVLLIGSLVRMLLLAAFAKQVLTTKHESDNTISTEKMRSLWLHLGLYDISQMVFPRLDKFLISAFLSAGISAIYYNGTQDVPFLSLMLGAVGSALLLQMGGNKGSDGERLELLRYSSAMLGRIVFPLFFFLAFFRNELFSVVLSAKYSSAAPLFFISILVVPLRTYNFTTILQHHGKGRIINAGALLDFVIAMILIYPFYLLWSLKGVAFAFVVCTYVQAGFYLYKTSRLLDCSISRLIPLKAWCIQLLAFFGAYILLYNLLKAYYNPVYTLILGGSITLAVIAFSIIPKLLQNRK